MTSSISLQWKDWTSLGRIKVGSVLLFRPCSFIFCFLVGYLFMSCTPNLGGHDRRNVHDHTDETAHESYQFLKDNSNAGYSHDVRYSHWLDYCVCAHLSLFWCACLTMSIIRMAGVTTLILVTWHTIKSRSFRTYWHSQYATISSYNLAYLSSIMVMCKSASF